RIRRPKSGGQLRVDDGQALHGRHITESLIRADEVIDRRRLVGVQSNGQLKGIKGAHLAGEAVVLDEVLGTVVMHVQKAYDLVPSACDVGGEESSEPGELCRIELPGPDLDGENRDGLNERQASDE